MVSPPIVCKQTANNRRVLFCVPTHIIKRGNNRSPLDLQYLFPFATIINGSISITTFRAEQVDTTMNEGNPAQIRGLRIVAVLEGAKGAIVLLTGFGILAIIHEGAHHAIEQLVRYLLHINPAHHYRSVFINVARHVTDLQLWVLAICALCYAVVRFVEAYGLWRRMAWSQWFGLVTGGMYIPLELFEVAHRATWPKITILAVNLGVVGYLAFVLVQSRQK